MRTAPRGAYRPLSQRGWCRYFVQSLLTRHVASRVLASTTDGIDSSTAAGRMVIGVLASMAQFERELVKERTALKREAPGRTAGSSAVPQGRRLRAHRHGEADEGRRSHREGHRQAPRGKPCPLSRHLTDGAAWSAGASRLDGRRVCLFKACGSRRSQAAPTFPATETRGPGSSPWAGADGNC